MASPQKTYVVEHLDPELGPWSGLEYATIALESHAAGATFCLSSVPESLELPGEVKSAPGLVLERRSIETIYSTSKDKVCLLDPAASQELSPDDGERFEVFLFGGILGESTCALPVSAPLTLSRR